MTPSFRLFGPFSALLLGCVLSGPVGAEPLDSDRFIGREVVNRQGDGLGEIEALAINYHASNVAYAVLSYGGYFDGVLGLESKRFAVTAAALALHGEQMLLDLDPERLDRIEGFDQYDWPDMKDRDWADKLHSFYQLIPKWQQLRPEGKLTEIERANAVYMQSQSIGVLKSADDIVGMAIHDSSDQTLGEIEALLIDWDADQTVQAEVSLDGQEKTLSLTDLTLKAVEASTELRFSPDHYWQIRQ